MIHDDSISPIPKPVKKKNADSLASRSPGIHLLLSDHPTTPICQQLRKMLTYGRLRLWAHEIIWLGCPWIPTLHGDIPYIAIPKLQCLLFVDTLTIAGIAGASSQPNEKGTLKTAMRMKTSRTTGVMMRHKTSSRTCHREMFRRSNANGFFMKKTCYQICSNTPIFLMICGIWYL